MRIRRAAAVLGVVALAAIMTGCGATRHVTTAATAGSNAAAPTSTPAPTTAAGAATTGTPAVAHLIPTAPNCGGGAYKPATLLIVCAVGDQAVMATGVSWRSWGATAAVGSGTMHVVVNGHPTARPATLNLAGVVTGSVGPQFTQLTVTWIGSSPTGSPQASYHLQPGGLSHEAGCFFGLPAGIAPRAKAVRRTLIAMGFAVVVATIVRLRGSGGTPPQRGGWRELPADELD